MKAAPPLREDVPAKQRSLLAHPTPHSLVTMLCALGPGMLAYGDSSARTHLSSTFRPTPESHREVQRTVYFRRHFKLDPDTAAALRAGTHRLWLRMLVDDGVIVYVCGGLCMSVCQDLRLCCWDTYC